MNMSEEKIVLTLDAEPVAPDMTAFRKAAEKAAEAVSTAAASSVLEKKADDSDGSYLANVNLSEEELKTVEDFAEKIDFSNANVIMQYGVACQKKISEFADSALDNVRTKDLGEVGDMIANLVTELQGFDPDKVEKKKGLFSWFRKKKTDLKTLNAKYDTTEANVNKIVEVLEGQQNQLLTDVVLLDNMYDSNTTYFKELTMYILAGKKKLESEENGKLAELRKTAENSGLAEDAQKANDYAALCDRFDKKLTDLELTRTISMQMAPQIRLIQNSDVLMSEKITSIVNNTIPLWKNQMVLALGMSHAENAMKAEQAVTNLTNELIKENAEKLKTGSVEIAKESARGIIDLETVKYANAQLIESLDEVIRIGDESRTSRRQAEHELYVIEEQLKKKLLDIRNNTVPVIPKADPVPAEDVIEVKPEKEE